MIPPSIPRAPQVASTNRLAGSKGGNNSKRDESNIKSEAGAKIPSTTGVDIAYSSTDDAYRNSKKYVEQQAKDLTEQQKLERR